MKKSITLLLAMLMACSFVACDEEEGHKHTYATTYSSDATKHWKAATCCPDEKGEIDGHLDSDKDGDCDVCGYVDETHAHTYFDSWSSDESKHWKDATCGHAVKTEEADHTANAVGDCTVCGYHVADPDVSTVEKAIKLAYSQEDKVATGTMDWTSTNSALYYPSYTSLTYEMSEGYKKTVSTLYGYSESYYNPGWTKEITENWYYAYNGGIVGLTRNEEGGDAIRINEPLDENVLKGYAFAGTSIDYAQKVGGYGLEEYMNNLYAFIADEQNEGGEDTIVEIINVNEDVEDGVYTLDFVYLEMWQATENGSAIDEYYAAEYTEVSISFSLNDAYIIGDLTMTVDVYNDEAIAEYENNKVGDYSLVENAEPARSHAYRFRQSDGVVNPFVLDELFATSFDVMSGSDAGATVLDENEPINVVKGTYNYFPLKNIVPETTSFAIDKPVVTVTKDGVDVSSTYWSTTYYASERNSLCVNISDVGEYQITLSTFNVSKTYTVNVGYAETTSFYASAQASGSWTGSSVTTASIYEGSYLQFKAVVNSNAEGKMSGTITTPATGSTAATLTYDEDSGYYVFYPDVTGTYTLTFTSTDAKKASSVTESTFTVTVNEKPNIATILTGVYSLDMSNYTAPVWEVTFSNVDDSQKANGIYSGDLTIKLEAEKYDRNLGQLVTIEETCVYTYTFKEGEGFTQTLVSGDNTAYSSNAWNLYMTDAYELRIMSASSSMYTLTKTADEAPEIVPVAYDASKETAAAVGLNQTFTYGNSYKLDLSAATVGTQYVLSTSDANAKLHIYTYANEEYTLSTTVVSGTPYTFTVSADNTVLYFTADAIDQESNAKADIYVNDPDNVFGELVFGLDPNYTETTPVSQTLTYGTRYFMDLSNGYTDGTEYTFSTTDANARIQVMAQDSSWKWVEIATISAGNDYVFTVGDDGYTVCLFVATVDGTEENIDVVVQ